MILTTIGGLLIRDRESGPLSRTGLYAETVGGPGARAELDVDEVESLVDELQDWLERNGRGRRS